MGKGNKSEAAAASSASVPTDFVFAIVPKEPLWRVVQELHRLNDASHFRKMPPCIKLVTARLLESELRKLVIRIAEKVTSDLNALPVSLTVPSLDDTGRIDVTEKGESGCLTSCQDRLSSALKDVQCTSATLGNSSVLSIGRPSPDIEREQESVNRRLEVSTSLAGKRMDVQDIVVMKLDMNRKRYAGLWRLPFGSSQPQQLWGLPEDAEFLGRPSDFGLADDGEEEADYEGLRVSHSAAGTKKKDAEKGRDKKHKKERLRTADEVIDQLLWDSKYKEYSFSVAWMDRVQGIKYMPIEEWASSDRKDVSSDFFVPSHRVRGIVEDKTGAIVWDREERSDFVKDYTAFEALLRNKAEQPKPANENN